MKLEIKLWYYRMLDTIPRKLANVLPKRLVMWAFFRVIGHATSGKYDSTIVDEITWNVAIDRWCADKGIK